MKAYIISCVLIACANYVFAQAGASLDVNTPGNSNGYGLVRFSNPSAGNGKIGDVDMDEVAGSPYYNTNWGPAVIVLLHDKPVKVLKARLNLCNNELHYIDTNNTEMVVDDRNVKKVFFMDGKDTSKVTALFQVIQNFNGKVGGTYMQALNTGTIQLLKLNVVEVKKRDYDVMSGKTSYSFQPNTSYLFLRDGNLLPCKTLSKADIFTVLLPDAAANSWLVTNKNKLRNEKEVTSFLAYYNVALTPGR
ncbi:MAG TPA: hypothetical protein VG738_20240 [Chitinophagaceae bacterium]|nr:hypothetical protein [Chitinophagaceae bacterium]